MRALLNAGADANLGDGDDTKPIVFAVYAGSVDSVQLLLDAGADPNADADEGEKVLHAAACRGEGAIVEQLCKAGASLEARSAETGQTPLHIAAYTSAFHASDTVAALIAAGADVNARDDEGKTPYIWARSALGDDAAGVLTDAGADPAARDEHGMSGDDYAAELVAGD